MHTSIFSHTQETTRAGSLVYVRVESGRERARKTLTDYTDNFQQFLNGCRPQGLFNDVPRKPRGTPVTGFDKNDWHYAYIELEIACGRWWSSNIVIDIDSGKNAQTCSLPVNFLFIRCLQVQSACSSSRMCNCAKAMKYTCERLAPLKPPRQPPWTPEPWWQRVSCLFAILEEVKGAVVPFRF